MIPAEMSSNKNPILLPPIIDTKESITPITTTVYNRKLIKEKKTEAVELQGATKQEDVIDTLYRPDRIRSGI